MRSLTQFAKVEGHSTLIRDMSSHAIISTDDNEFNAYKKKREAEKKRNSVIEDQQKEIQSLRNDMLEIKQLLRDIAQLRSENGN